MTKKEFIRLVVTQPTTTKEAVILADRHGVIFKRRNAHLKAWFGTGGHLLPSMHNLKG